MTWTGDGELPSGITLSTAGVLSGTPVEAGSFPVTYAVSDERGQVATKRLTLVVADSPAPLIADSKLPAGQIGVGYAYRIRTVAGRLPFTWSITAGALPASLALDTTTGLVSGTPTGVASTSVTIRVTDADGDASSKALPIAVDPATTWQQDGGNESQSGYVAGERGIDAETSGAVRREWTIPGACCFAPSAIAGGLIYTGGPLPDSERNGVTARDLRSGDVMWSAEIADGGGGSRVCSSVAVTAASVICSTGLDICAISRSGGHEVQWSTAETDPGVYLQQPTLVIESAGLVVGISGNNRDVIVAYRLSDGQRMWQRNVDHYIFSLAAGDGRLYVGTVVGDGSDNGSLETFALNSTGTPGLVDDDRLGRPRRHRRRGAVGGVDGRRTRRVARRGHRRGAPPLPSSGAGLRTARRRLGAGVRADGQLQRVRRFVRHGRGRRRTRRRHRAVEAAHELSDPRRDRRRWSRRLGARQRSAPLPHPERAVRRAGVRWRRAARVRAG